MPDGWVINEYDDGRCDIFLDRYIVQYDLPSRQDALDEIESQTDEEEITVVIIESDGYRVEETLV